MTKLAVATFAAVILGSGISKILSSPLEGSPCPVKCPSGVEIEFCRCQYERFECCADFCMEPTCLRPNTTEVKCKRCPSGCFCRKGYIRSVQDGPCVKESQCDEVILSLIEDGEDPDDVEV